MKIVNIETTGEKMFKLGEKVYHKNLKKMGVFNGYDDLDTNTCYVSFDFDEELRIYLDERRVSINQLISEDKILSEKD